VTVKRNSPMLLCAKSSREHEKKKTTTFPMEIRPVLLQCRNSNQGGESPLMGIFRSTHFCSHIFFAEPNSERFTKNREQKR
jgi:hypothetical protein